MTHGHGPPGAALLAATLLAVAAVAYLAASGRVLRSGGCWALPRTASWLAGLAAVAAAVVGPLAGSVDPRAHAAAHVLLGMAGPLLLVLGAPVTLALRVLPVARARLLARVLRSRPAAVLGHPVTAALLDTGGLWVMYVGGVPLPAVHVLAGGYLFAHALVGPDPSPHRAPFAVRATVFVLAAAAHDVLTKVLAARGDAGAEVVHYGALPVELAIAVLLWRRRAAGVARRRPPARRTTSPGSARSARVIPAATMPSPVLGRRRSTPDVRGAGGSSP